MAVADVMVVMNGGRIEQAGSPRDIFNAPRTEFVARFIGGHNVMTTPAGPIAVRTDRLALTRGASGTGSRLRATVRAVEYQGDRVHVALDGTATDLTAVMSDERYDTDPVRPGDEVEVGWSEADIRTLQPAA